jgi:hypothetical protein
MRYRPDGWQNPYPEVIGDSYGVDAYEAGADAILEALIGKGKRVVVSDKIISIPSFIYKKSGTLVFIPDEEE